LVHQHSRTVGHLDRRRTRERGSRQQDSPSGTDPLCWPYHATVDELAGLPPHLISVNELDLVRDQGVVYYQKLKRAGVAANLRTVPGAHARHLPSDRHQHPRLRCKPL